MRNIMTLIAILTLSLGLGSCSGTSLGSGETDAAVMSANYTNDYIRFTLMSQAGKNLGIGGDANPFTQGGTGGMSCCARLPGVGRTLRVELKVGGFDDTADQYKTYTRDVIVKGITSTSADRHSYLIVRIFPDHEIEAEFVPGDDPRGMKNPRVDQLLLGRRVMRQPGD